MGRGRRGGPDLRPGAHLNKGAGWDDDVLRQELTEEMLQVGGFHEHSAFCCCCPCVQRVTGLRPHTLLLHLPSALAWSHRTCKLCFSLLPNGALVTNSLNNFA